MEKQENKIELTKGEAEKMKKESYRPTVILKTFAQAAKKLEENKLITKEELEKIKEIHKNAMTKYMGENMFN